MAGSYKHCRREDGGFDFAPIENMRDAYEACEEMFFLIDRLSGGGAMERIEPLLGEFYAAARGEPVSAAGALAYARVQVSELAQQRAAYQAQLWRDLRHNP